MSCYKRSSALFGEKWPPPAAPTPRRSPPVFTSNQTPPTSPAWSATCWITPSSTNPPPPASNYRHRHRPQPATERGRCRPPHPQKAPPPGVPPFYRLPGQTISGYGLGLHYVRTAVRAAGGRARIEDSPLGGNRFVVTYPRASPPPPVSPRPPRSPGPPVSPPAPRRGEITI